MTADPPAAEETAGPVPLGAPSDPLRPTGRVRATSASRGSSSTLRGFTTSPVDPPVVRKEGSVVIGIGLALVVVLAFLLSGSAAAWLGPRLSVATLATFIAAIVGLHVYAFAKDRLRILAGFWIALVVAYFALMILVFAIAGFLFSR